MRLGGRLAAAIEVLEDIGTRHRPAAEALRDWGLSHRFAGASDRAAIGNIVYDSLRRGAGSPRRGESQRDGAVVLEWGESADGIDAAFDGDRFAPPRLDDGERRAIATRRLDDAPDAVRADCPDWCTMHFEAVFGDDWVAEAAALAARPPLDLRANRLKSTREKVLDEPRRSLPAPTAIAPDGVRIAPVAGGGRHPNVQVEPAFRKGWFEIQDEGSQIAALLANAASGMQVLDFCAGSGGKTLAMSAAMGNRGQIFAHDADKARLAPIFDRLRRADCRNVQVLANTAELSPLAGRMDRVLVDAPCTGTGTWRRKPDAKWRLTQRQLEARMSEQQAILDDAAGYVRPGGRLVYVTCSVFAGENERQVAAFLDRNAGFRPADHATLWREALPGTALPTVRLREPAGILMTPARTATDGFFVAVLERRAPQDVGPA